MKASSGQPSKDIRPRANSRQDNRHMAQEDSSDITRQLQYLSENKQASGSNLSGSGTQQRQKSSSRPDILGTGDTNQTGNGSKKGSRGLNSRRKTEIGLAGVSQQQKMDSQNSPILDANLLTTEVDDILELKEAIIELYLAIKIRSTEELDLITDTVLEDEKRKLEKVSGFQVLEYIRTSIEIIMNLKIEDLEKEFNNRNKFERDSQGSEYGVSTMSVASTNLIQQSMKDAISAMMETQETHRSVTSKNPDFIKGPSKKYEKIIQKMEADVRGHIRLEHEMKIHMDYLENKIETFQSQMANWEKEKTKLQRTLETAQDKLSLVKDAKERETRDLNRKLNDLTNKLNLQLTRTTEVEQQLNLERDNFQHKLQSMNSSVEYKSTDHSGILSSKSKQKNQKYLTSINSGSKTTQQQTSGDQQPGGHNSSQLQNTKQSTSAYHSIGQNMQVVSNTSLDRQANKRKSDLGTYPPNINNFTISHQQMRVQEEQYDRPGQAMNPYLADNVRNGNKKKPSNRKSKDSVEMNTYVAAQRQPGVKTNFTGSSSFGGLHVERQEGQNNLNYSIDNGKPIHSHSQSYSASSASAEVIGKQLKKTSGKEDLFANDEVLHEYPEMPNKTKFIKSVDEGAFTRMKQANSNSATLKERGSSHNTIEHVAASQINPFTQNSFPLQNQAHVRSSTITSKPRKKSSNRNENPQNQSLESNNTSLIAPNHNQNAHTSIVVRNQINIINNGTQSQAATTGTGQQQKHAISQQQSTTGSSKVQGTGVSGPVTQGNSNTRSKVSTRKTSQIHSNKPNQMYVPNQSQSQVGNMYNGIDANNLVNFYNSNILDEMLSKNQGKFINKSFTNNLNPHLRKSAQSALANPTTAVHQKPGGGNLSNNSLLKQQIYSGTSQNNKTLQSSGNLDVSNGRTTNNNSRSLHSRGKESQDLGIGSQDIMIYANQGSSKTGIHLRPSSAIRHQQHQQQLKVKGQNASNIKIKGSNSIGAKHAHNQSVAVVSQTSYPKQNMGSIDNLSQGGVKKMVHQKHQSMNNHRASSNVQNSATVLNTSAHNVSASPSAMVRNKKTLYRMSNK